jgi:hypothetical protein
MVVAAVVVAVVAAPVLVRPQETGEADLSGFLTALQEALLSGDRAAYAALAAPPAGAADAAGFAEEAMLPGATQVTLRERDRTPLAGSLPGEGFRLMVEILTERGRQARLATWRLDVRLARGATGQPWRLVDQERLSVLDGLFRLEIDPTREFTVRDLVIESTDLWLTMSSGHAFVATAGGGVTVLVLRGKGEMRFAPHPQAERTQLRIFGGADALVTPFDEAFVRISPATFDRRVAPGALTERSVNAGDLRKAREVFDDFVRKSYTLDLADISQGEWSLLPLGDDLLAEVHTKKFDTLTYTQSSNEPEDISLFNRAKRRNISVYASPEKLERRGPFFNEDDYADFDVLDYKISATIDPRRQWIDGLATLTLRVTGDSISSVTLRLDEALTVRAVSSPGFGRLMHLRVVGQNNLVVNLPSVLVRDTEFELTVSYAGHLPPQSLEREAIYVQQEQQVQDFQDVTIPPQEHLVYSNRTHWYPRSPVSDYATATVRITLPADFDCVATGLQAVGSPIELAPTAERKTPLKIYVFIAGRPVRYVSCVISRFVAVGAPVEVPPPSTETDGADQTVGQVPGGVTFQVQANPRQQGRARDLTGTATAILQFYMTLMGDAPYPSFTLALTESNLPGGHSPAYFAILNQPMPTSPFRWRNDPVSFDNFPSFFLAHEIAHQWWGQGVGWQNYHEQWLSEGLAQYFAALYAEHDRGEGTLDNLLRQMRTWSLRFSDQGPIYLGYRLGHVKGDSRVFRALVYNKAAEVLHMLRRLVGDEAFFTGLRRFYAEFKYRKAGSDDLRQAMEAASGRPLGRFFEQWIYESALPRVRFSSREHDTEGTDGGSVTLRFEQQGETFDLPVTVTLVFESGETRDVLVKLTDKVTELTVPLEGRLREVEVNQDNAALAEFDG